MHYYASLCPFVYCYALFLYIMTRFYALSGNLIIFEHLYALWAIREGERRLRGKKGKEVGQRGKEEGGRVEEREKKTGRMREW